MTACNACVNVCESMFKSTRGIDADRPNEKHSQEDSKEYSNQFLRGSARDPPTSSEAPEIKSGWPPTLKAKLCRAKEGSVKDSKANIS